MGLMIAAPYRHPETGIYIHRRRIPADLIKARDQLASLGINVRSHLKVSLGTREPTVAKTRRNQADMAFEAVWGAWRKLLREGPRKLSQREVFALSADFARTVVKAMRENPGDPGRLRKMEEVLATVSDHPYAEELSYLKSVLWALLPKRGIVALHPASEEALLKQFTKDASAIACSVATMAEGDYSEQAWLAKRPKMEESSPAVTFADLIAGWQNEMAPEKRNKATERTYKYRIADFREGLAHDDAARITADDVIAWHDRMLAVEGPARLSNKAINGKLQALSTLLAWGVRKRKLPANVALGIRVRTDGVRSRKRGFTPDEMRTILKAARKCTRPEDAMRRWAPFVMAYSGARIGEVARLRCEDIIRAPDGGGWQMTFTRKAGSLKTQGSERTIPVHPALVEEGFIEYVEAMRKQPKGLWPKEGEGRVFPFLYLRDKDNSPHAVARRGRTRTDKWIFGEKGRKGKKARRGLLKPDPTLSPNHGWRHAFKTLCRANGMDQECRDAIEGHHTNGAAPDYGEWTVAAMRREMEKIPAITLDGSEEASR
ncbi:MAG: DUF6538 domain-containing protein [Thermomicrobiales bacterium]